MFACSDSQGSVPTTRRSALRILLRPLALMAIGFALSFSAGCDRDRVTAPETTEEPAATVLAWLGSASGDDAPVEFALTRIDLGSGGYEVIGGFDYFTSLVYDQDGRLFGIDRGINQIDPMDGTVVHVADFARAAFPDSTFLVSDAAVAPDGDLYVNHWGVIYRADWQTGQLEYVGEEGEREVWAALSFGDEGDLYTGFGQLYNIDRNARVLRTIGRFPGSYLSVLTPGQSTSWLFGVDTSEQRLYRVDLSGAELTIALDNIGLPIRAVVLEKPLATRSLDSVDGGGYRRASWQQLRQREIEDQQRLREQRNR